MERPFSSEVVMIDVDVGAQALQQFGDVKGEYAPHPSSGMAGGMLKFYFLPSNRKRLPPTIQFIRPDR